MPRTSRAEMAAQYGTDANLAARQALHRFRRPGPTIWDWALALGGGVRAGDVVVDAGCGNGNYLAALPDGAAGVGFDLSPGMAAAALERSGRPAGVADLASMPVRAASVDVALCMHMLYHLADQAAGAAELRRIVRPGGRALVLTNSEHAMAELNELVEGVTGRPAMRGMLAFTVEGGEPVLRTAFDAVELHTDTGWIDVSDAGAVVAYVGSAPTAFGDITDDELAEVGRRAAAAIERDGAFAIGFAYGCFVCR